MLRRVHETILIVALAALLAPGSASAAGPQRSVDPVASATARIEAALESAERVAPVVPVAPVAAPVEVSPLPHAEKLTIPRVRSRRGATRTALAAARRSLGPILVEERVPIELVSVAFVESGFNPYALSPKGARGIWQFIPSTARRYGLAVRAGVDDRTHPERSTKAAARYLRDLYAQFGDWKLALAAYNAGEARVWRAIRKSGTRDFEEISRLRLLPAETRAYVPSVLAVWSLATTSVEAP